MKRNNNKKKTYCNLKNTKSIRMSATITNVFHKTNAQNLISMLQFSNAWLPANKTTFAVRFHVETLEDF